MHPVYMCVCIEGVYCIPIAFPWLNGTVVRDNLNLLNYEILSSTTLSYCTTIFSNLNFAAKLFNPTVFEI